MHEVYKWRPPVWHIPREDELSALEALLCRPGDFDTQLPVTSDGEYFYLHGRKNFDLRGRQWFFSAAAVATEYCK